MSEYSRYGSLVLDPLQQVREPQKVYTFLTERHVQAMWLEGKYFKGLKTFEGLPVKVLSPGIWNSEAGPDFLKAHLIIGDQELRGDIEIHLSDSGWKAHGHHLDPNYNNVIFHLSLWHPVQQHPLYSENNTQLVQAYLEEYLTVPTARIARLIDLNLYPYKKFIGSGRCAQKLFKKMPENEVIHFLQDASLWRLAQKRMWLQEKVQNSHYLLAGGFAAALGYKKNTESFMDMFMWLQESKLGSEEDQLAVAMGIFGFFSEKFKAKWSTSKKYKQLHERYLGYNMENTPSIALNLDRIRPHNHPIRRVLYLIKFLNTGVATSLYSEVLQIWRMYWKEISTKKGCRDFKENLLEKIPVFEDNYWNHHYLFEPEPKNNFLPLVGHTFKHNVLMNTLFPLLHGDQEIKSDPDQIEALRYLFSNLTVAQTSKSRYMVHRLFGDSSKGTLLSKGDTEQGAYQLHKDFCLHYEASCEGCPFIDRYHTVYN